MHVRVAHLHMAKPYRYVFVLLCQAVVVVCICCVKLIPSSVLPLYGIRTPDFKSKLVHGLAFGTAKFYIAPYDKINHRLLLF